MLTILVWLITNSVSSFNKTSLIPLNIYKKTKSFLFTNSLLFKHNPLPIFWNLFLIHYRMSNRDVVIGSPSDQLHTISSPLTPVFFSFFFSQSLVDPDDEGVPMCFILAVVSTSLLVVFILAFVFVVFSLTRRKRRYVKRGRYQNTLCAQYAACLFDFS